jgi:hypothetical protein
MELLVVGSCTDKKDIRDCPYSLTEADFDDDPATLPRTQINSMCQPFFIGDTPEQSTVVIRQPDRLVPEA